MPEQRLRLDKTEIDEQVIAFMRKRADRWVIVHHVVDGENPHQHAQVETKQSANNFPKYIKEEFSVSGNGGQSNARCDPDRRLEQLAYLFNVKKGNKPRLVHYEGFNMFDIHAAQERAKTIATEYETKIKEQKPTRFEIAKRVHETVRSGHLNDYYHTTVELLHKNHMCSGMFIVRDIIGTALAMKNDTPYREQVLKIFMDRPM